MKLLLDTHVLLAVFGKRTGGLDAKTQLLLTSTVNEFHVSVASIWEIVIKSRLGKLKLGFDLEALPELIAALGLAQLPIYDRHVLARFDPEPPTRDPFDRLLLAQCRAEAMLLVTVDRALVGHPLSASKG